MSNSENKQEPFALHVLAVAKVCAYFVEDVSRALLGFIPNGLNLTYDFALKSLPMVGKFFSHRWVEQVIKLCSGITIGQGLSGDIAHFIFRPIGSAIGFMLGAVIKTVPVYQGQIGKVLYRLSGQTIGGAVFGILAFLIGLQFISSAELNLSASFAVAAGVGAFLGLVAKAFLLIAINTVNSANAKSKEPHIERSARYYSANEWSSVTTVFRRIL